MNAAECGAVAFAENLRRAKGVRAGAFKRIDRRERMVRGPF